MIDTVAFGTLLHPWPQRRCLWTGLTSTHTAVIPSGPPRIVAERAGRRDRQWCTRPYRRESNLPTRRSANQWGTFQPPTIDNFQTGEGFPSTPLGAHDGPLAINSSSLAPPAQWRRVARAVVIIQPERASSYRLAF